MAADPTQRRDATGLRRLLGAAWISNFGDGVRVAALPLLAASLTRDPAAIAGVTVAQHLPWVVFGLVAGVVVDRRPRVPLVVFGLATRAVSVASLAVAIGFDMASIPLLYVLSFVFGLGETLGDSADQALLPDLVEREDLERANGSLVAAEMTANDLVGPPLGGLLFAVGRTVPFVVDAVSFVVAALVIRPIRALDEHLSQRRQAVRADLAEGLRTVWANPILRVTSVAVVVLQIVHNAALSILVLYATGPIGLGEAEFGILLGVGSIGGLAGSQMGPRAVARFGAVRVWPIALLLGSAGFATMLFPHAAWVGLGYMLSFGGVVVGRVIVMAARQRSVGSNLLGRVAGSARTLVWGAAAVGAALGGALASFGGLRLPFAVAAVTYLVVAAATTAPLARALKPLGATSTSS